MDFTAAGTDHRRRVAEAARKRLAVLDHATHYTSTTYAAEPRVVDHGHGGDHGHGAGSWQKTDVVDRPLGSRVEVSHRAVRNSPPRAPQGTAGVRVRAAAGAGSYASMYEERLGADASARRAFPGTGPKPKPRVGRGRWRRNSARFRRFSSAPSWATSASDGKTRADRAHRRTTRTARATETWTRPGALAGRRRTPGRRTSATWTTGTAARGVARRGRTQPRAVSTTRRSAHPATGVR